MTLDANGIAAIIAAVTGLVGAVGAYLNGRAIQKVSAHTDGMSTQLQIMARKAGFDAGQANPAAGKDAGATAAAEAAKPPAL